jgi:hypothetical protein
MLTKSIFHALTTAGMKFQHHTLFVELPDAWWYAAGMEDFVAREKSFRVDETANSGQEIFYRAIADIAPVQRKVGIPIFNNNEIATAQKRVTDILKGFREGSRIPPIKVVPLEQGAFKFKLTAGVHRLYCSLAAGFTHVPAVEGFDITKPYI